MSDKDSAMKIMNDARASTGGKERPPLEWDDSLASDAEAWAKKNAEKNQMEHSDNSSRENQGENLFAAMPDASFEAAAKAWIDEKSKYHGQPIDQNFSQYGHYTQCVWPSTTKVGMAKAKSKEGWEYVCARYSPAGNMMGESAH